MEIDNANYLPNNVIQTRSKKMKTDDKYLPINVIQACSKKMETDMDKNLLQPKSVKRKAIDNSPINVLQTRSKKMKRDNGSNLSYKVIQNIKPVNTSNIPCNVIQIRSKKIKLVNTSGTHCNVIKTQSKKIKSVNISNITSNIQIRRNKLKPNNANNLPCNIIQTRRNKIKPDYVSTLPCNIIRTRRNKIKSDNVSIVSNVIQTRRNKIKPNNASNLPCNIIQTQRNNIKSDNVSIASNVIQTRSNKIKPNNASNLPCNIIQTRRNNIKPDNAILSSNIIQTKRNNIKSDNVSIASNVIQTRRNKIKPNNARNLPCNIIQTRRKNIKPDNAILSSNIIQTRRNKIKYDNASNLPRNIIQTRRNKIKSDNAILSCNVIQKCNRKTKTINVNNLLEPNISYKLLVKIMLQYLPDLVLESIFNHLTFHEISTLRIVCRRFNEICKRLLNKGCRDFRQYISEFIQKVGKLSESFNFYLYDIDAQFSMLDLTFYPHITENRCCFFTGKVLDVLISNIIFIKNNVNTKKSFKVYKYSIYKPVIKFRDLCNAAVWYAVEDIFPAFNISMKSTSIILLSSTSMFVDELVLKSALGNLTGNDVGSYHFNAFQSFYHRMPRISLIDQFKMIKIKYDDPMQELDRHLVPEKVLGKFKENNEKFVYLVKWKGRNEAGFVYRKKLSKFCHFLPELQKSDDISEYQYSIGNMFN